MRKARTIQEGTDEKQLDGFIQLIGMEWCDEVSRQAHTTLYEEKWNREDLLPLTEDLIKLQHHLSEKIEAGIGNLKKKSNKRAPQGAVRSHSCPAASV